MINDNSNFPKINNSKIIEEQGLTILKSITENELGWMFKKNNLEDDFGIDGYLEIISEKGQVTGKSIAFQLKTGKSFFKEQNEIGYVFRGKNKHLNYYLNLDIPILIILIDPVKSEVIWQIFDGSKTEKAGNNWKLTIPKNQILNIKSKPDLMNFVGPITDYVSQLEQEWQINEMLKAGNNRILFRIPKEEILNKKYQFILSGLERVQATAELVLNLKNRIDISFDDYESDERELFEIPEVKNWILELYSKSNCWPYLMAMDHTSGFMRLLFYCQIENLEIIRDHKARKFDVPYSGEDFKKIVYPMFHKLNKYCKEKGLSMETNKEISTLIANYYSQGQIPL
ncbi:DUF4365 domain-containing protein [uncultured Christiangramia sp.]|uniref:DUF4365 domain-containing protein n=1 Tax=Christiangramia sp. 3-2217-3z TaxID=3417564 RepID=UPI002634B8D3|nr:DUF4365 and DUF1817 domain-containing protein [uncultured Christiangramia sp.]